MTFPDPKQPIAGSPDPVISSAALARGGEL